MLRCTQKLLSLLIVLLFLTISLNSQTLPSEMPSQRAKANPTANLHSEF